MRCRVGGQAGWWVGELVGDGWWLLVAGWWMVDSAWWVVGGGRWAVMAVAVKREITGMGTKEKAMRPREQKKG